MNHLNKIAVACALLGCAVSGSVLAQSTGYDASAANSYNPSWYVMPSITATRPDGNFNAGSRGEGLGLRMGKPVSPMWDIQVGPTFSRSNDGDNRYRRNTLGLDGLYFFTRDRFRPLVLIGLGAEFDKASNPNGQASGTAPYVNLGLGFQYAFNDQWGMQADVRRAHSYLKTDTFGFSRANTNVLQVGLIYTFDKPMVAPAPVVRADPPAPMVQAAPAPMPVAPPVVVVPPPRFERYTLSSTELFGFDSAELNGPQPKLDEISEALRRNAQVTNVVITGYTDRLGSKKYNEALSQRRANTVKAYFTAKGIDASRLTAVGKGETNPVVECHEKKRPALINCLEPNRRVEVEQIVIERRVQ